VSVVLKEPHPLNLEATTITTMRKDSSAFIPQERIVNTIVLIRGKKVMLDSDLAELYDVETKALNRAVKRNRERFPDDFMYQLTKEELENLRYQIGTSSMRSRSGTSSSGYGGRRYLPLVFTELGVAMLSSVLHSKRAIQVNIQIMRAFTRLRDLLATHKDLREKVEKLERKYAAHDEHFKVVFEAIRQLLTPPEEPPKRRIGFGVE